MKRMLLGLGCWWLLTGIALAGDWPQFRGPGGTGVSDDTGLPTRWGPTENIRWKADLPGRGLSSPVIANGRVYVTACTGYLQTRLHVLCFDAATGKRLWERQFWATGNTVCHNKTSMAAPTPVTDGKHIYALFATCDLAALDAEGNLLWYRSLIRDYPTITNQLGMAASPILWKDLLILLMENAGESFAAGIDKHTGQNRWKVERDREINWTTPLVIGAEDRAEVLFQTSRGISAHNPATGRIRWTYEAGSTIPSPAAGNGFVLVPGGELFALRPIPDKSTPEVLWKSNRLRPATGSPLYYQDRVYTVNSAGVLNCGEAASGKVLWQERLKGPFSASPIAADGKLYLVNEEGTTSVVQAGDQPRVLGTNALNETILASPAVADGAIFLRSDQHLYCIAEKRK